MDGLESFLDAYGLIAIFGIMLLKSAGIPIPIPADVLMLATSARVAAGKLVLPSAFAALLVALVIGGVIQFGIVRGPGRNLLYRYGRYLGITPSRLDAAGDRLRKGGTLGIGLAVLTPGIRSIAVPACGLAGIALRPFSAGLTLGSGTFLALHFILGLIGGAALSALGNTISPTILIGGIIVLLLLGLGAWYIIRRRQKPTAPAGEILREAVGAWHEATCPVCLALGAAGRLQIDAKITNR